MTAQTPVNREVAVDQTVYYEEKINPILDEISRAVGCGEWGCAEGDVSVNGRIVC